MGNSLKSCNSWGNMFHATSFFCIFAPSFAIVMKKIVFISLLWMVQAVFAQFHQPVQFSVRQNKLSDTEIEVVFTGKVEPGWHVYSTDIADGGPTRAELTLEKQQGVRPDGRLRATGKVKREMDEMFGMELSFMEGTASFSQKFALTGGD